MQIVELREAGIPRSKTGAMLGKSEGSVLGHRLTNGIMRRRGHVARALTRDEDAQLVRLEQRSLNCTKIGGVIGRTSYSVRGRLATFARYDERAAEGL